jgi:protein-S-isoprenylcysteine O-methyltransferase Ste14
LDVNEATEWAWLALLIVISTVRKVHEFKAGQRSSLKGIPIPEATIMVLWGLAAAVLPMFYIFSPWLDFANLPVEIPLALRALGVALFVFAIWLLHRSHADLGRQWSPTVEFKDDHALVTEGVYARVRHPMYAAHVLWGIAQAMLLPNLIAGPLALILIFVHMASRIPREERAMVGEFGDAYRRYMRRTGRILPKGIVDPDPPNQAS